jgi:uncharacterized protein (DUF1015 family)
MNLLPFRAIFPNTKKYSFVLNQDKLYVNDTPLHTINKKKYYQYLLEKYNSDYFSKTSDECIYLAKKESLNCSSIGIVAKININALYGNKLVLHEETIRDKEIEYQEDLNKFNTLTSPLILGHKDSLEISHYYNKIMRNKHDIKIGTLNDNYYFWKLTNHELINAYFSNFEKFLVADGHHRISSLKKLRKKIYAHAFFISENTLHSKNIIRHYNKHVTANVLKTLEQKHDMQPVIHPIRNNKYIMLSHKGKISKLNSQNISLMRLFLKDTYNELSKDKINFKNKPVKLSNFRLNTQTALYIPAMMYRDLIDNNLIFPPHSTHFEPKLHNGIISFSGCIERKLT